MMKHLFFIVFLLSQLAAVAQVDEALRHRLNKPIPNCTDITYNSLKLIPAFYYGGHFDSIKEVLVYWIENCGRSNETRHLDILFRIEGGEFYPEDYPYLVELLAQYHDQQNFHFSGVHGFWGSDFNKVKNEYYDFLEELATEILAETFADGQERDILKYYAGNYEALNGNLRESNYRGSFLQAKFDTAINDVRYSSESSFGILTGLWLPTENLKMLGEHPEAGIHFGYFANKMHYDLVSGLRFVNAPREYRVFKDDSLYQTDRFVNFFVGVEVSRSLYRDFRNDLELGFGLGVDNLNIVPIDEEKGQDPVNLTTLDLNVGLGYRFYHNYKDYLKLDLRYHFLNYRNNLNNDLSGNAVTLRLIFGWTDNRFKKRRLEAFGY